MSTRATILVIEDVPDQAKIQLDALKSLYPEKRIIHVETLEDAEDVLFDSDLFVEGIMTDNGYPLKPGGERIGAKSVEGGAGTLLIKRLREGYFGKRYQKVRVAWHTEEYSKDKEQRVLENDGAYKGRTQCFKKGKTPDAYKKMAAILRPAGSTLH